MPTVTVSKKFTVNMGNYESYSPEFTVELSIPEAENYAGHLELLREASDIVDAAAYADLTEAAATTDVRNSYILTWLHNRKDEIYAKGNN